MGVVVEARHLVLDERVALKFLLAEYAHHPEASARFIREARAAVRIKSEHVARVSDVGTLENGAPYMVMEFLHGADLSQVLTTRGVLPIEDTIDFVLQACEAIAEAHGLGIVHRDLKPANLFLSKRPNGNPIVKVLDFGISKVADAVENLTKTTAAMGSALYMSPEQMQQTRGVDHRTDIYALGIALFELLAGKQPYFADTLTQLCAEVFSGTPTPLRALRPDVPDGLASVLEKAYARDRAHRHQSIAELVVALAPYAPTRSQGMIDSVAKLGGIPSAVAGVPSAVAEVPALRPVLASTPLLAHGWSPQESRTGSQSDLGGAPPVIPERMQSQPGPLHVGVISAGPVVTLLPLIPDGVPRKSSAGVVLAAVLGILGIGGVIAAGAFCVQRKPPTTTATSDPHSASMPPDMANGGTIPIVTPITSAMPDAGVILSAPTPAPTGTPGTPGTPGTRGSKPLAGQLGKPIVPATATAKPTVNGRNPDVGF